MLIKSFEGFRPRAIRREDGGWVIGYGHTLSAREGASVSEADAELLLRYDLLPVEKTVNQTVPGDLNQHQFDALVSFAFSVGVDRFADSDVRQRLNAGSPGEAADAMMGWPEPALPETALRRRAAERALFVANPLAPVALSDLLSAPLPPPAVAAPPAETEVEIATGSDAAPDTVPATVPEVAVPIDPRSAAVAALLGESTVRLVQVDAPPAPSNDNPPAEGPSGSEAVSSETMPEPANDEPSVAEAGVEARNEVESVEGQALAPAPVLDPVVLAATRYSPYAAVMVGPLPFLQPATPRHAAAEAEAEVRTIDRSVVEITPDEGGESSPDDNQPAPVVIEAPPDPADTVTDESAPASDPVLTVPDDAAEPVVTPSFPVVSATIDPAPSAEPVLTAFGDVPESVPTPSFPVETVTVDEAPAAEPGLTVLDNAPKPVQTPSLPVETVTVDQAPVSELILTPLEESPDPAIERPLWTSEERDAPDASETNLFGEDLALTQGGSIMRNDIEFEPTDRFDWSETGPFIFMGGVGLVSFGASMAAFRRAAEQSGGNELTLIGWVLALIGLACVGVSSINLYRRFGLPGGD